MADPANQLAPPRTFTTIKGFAPTVIPRVGKLRLGIKKKSRQGRPYPAEVDYFHLEPDLPGRQRIVELYGERPKRLLVTFASDDIGTVFPQAYKMYGKSLGLVCRGDGETAERVVIDRSDGKPKKVKNDDGSTCTEQVACPCEFLTGAKPKCRPIGNLMVIIPAVGWQAYQIDTSSYHTMKDIASEFSHWLAVLGGSVRGKLFWLTREPKDTFATGSKNVHYTLHLRLPEPDEYETALGDIRERMEAYESLMPQAVPGLTYETPAALPAGHPVEEPDLTAPQDLVDEEEIPEGLKPDELVDADQEPPTDEGFDEEPAEEKKPPKKKAAKKKAAKKKKDPEPPADENDGEDDLDW